MKTRHILGDDCLICDGSGRDPRGRQCPFLVDPHSKPLKNEQVMAKFFLRKRAQESSRK